MVAMETSGHVESQLSYQIVSRWFLEKVTKFGSVCFNIEKVINVQSRRGQNPPPGLDRVNIYLYLSRSSNVLLIDLGRPLGFMQISITVYTE